MNEKLVVCGCRKHLQIQTVCNKLEQLGAPYVVVDFGAGSKFSYDVPNRVVSIDGEITEIAAIWTADKFFVMPHGFSPEWVERYVYEIEWRGILRNFYNSFMPLCFNKPHARTFGEKKINQLDVASRIGFEIPETIVTNNSVALREKFHSDDQLITKLIGVQSLPFVRQPGTVETFSPSIEVFSVQYLAEHFDAFAAAPVLVQKYIERDFDYRISVVGSKIIAAKIAKPRNVADSRVLGENQVFEIVTIPSDIERKLFAFMEECDLNFGHFDLIYRDDKKFVFLECNPSGMWAFYDRNDEISTAYAEFFYDQIC